MSWDQNEYRVHVENMRKGDVLRREGEPSRMVLRVSAVKATSKVVTAWFMSGEPEHFRRDTKVTVLRDA